MESDLCSEAGILVRFVVLYIHGTLLTRKISLERDGIIPTHFGGILKGSDLCLDAEIVVTFVFLYFLIHRPLLRRKISLGPYGVTQSEI